MNNTNKEDDYVDEDSGILVEEYIKIIDPDDDVVLYEGRA
jgi:hypothetical protein